MMVRRERAVPLRLMRCCCTSLGGLLYRIIVVEAFFRPAVLTAKPTGGESCTAACAIVGITTDLRLSKLDESGVFLTNVTQQGRRRLFASSRQHRKRRIGGALGSQGTATLELSSSATEQALLPLNDQRYKVVTVWKYDESRSDAITIPWKAIGDVLLEMGAFVVSVDCSGGAESSTATELHTVNDDDHGSHSSGDKSDDHGDEDEDATLDGKERNRVMLTFAVGGGRDAGATLEQACALVGAKRCFAELEWEEGPVDCYDNWEAAAVSDGFETVYLSRLQIVPVQRDDHAPAGFQQMKLLEGQGWGDGEHPSTWMCLDFLEMAIQGGEEEVVDYGTGSGVLATAAALLGAKHVTGVDVDFEILAHARQNFLLNGVGHIVSDVHTREISIGDLSGEAVVVNMLAGPMRRLMPVLVLAVKAGGMLCLSGLRPSDIPVIKRDYGKYMEWDDAFEMTRSSDTWGEWMRIVGRPKAGLAVGGDLRAELERDFSEVAIS